MEEKGQSGMALESIGSKPGCQQPVSAESFAKVELKKVDWTVQQKFIGLIDAINHVLIALVASFILYYASRQYHVMNMHVMLCTIGYVLLMSEAIATLASGSVLTRVVSRRASRHVHWLLQVLGLICVLIGVGLMYNVKTKHFQSIHAITGFSSLVIMCALVVMGYPVMMAMELRKYVRPVFVKVLHNFLGVACYVIGMISQCYGYRKGWLRNVTQVQDVDVPLVVLTALITVLSLRNALVSLVRQTVTVARIVLSYISYENMEKPGS